MSSVNNSLCAQSFSMDGLGQCWNKSKPYLAVAFVMGGLIVATVFAGIAAAAASSVAFGSLGATM